MLLDVALRRHPGGVALRTVAIDSRIALRSGKAGFVMGELLRLARLLFGGRATRKHERGKRDDMDFFHELGFLCDIRARL
jgi:hypothetical protein